MSGIAVVYSCSNQIVPSGTLDPIMERLTHRGPDGSRQVYYDSVAMGHLHFWTTPEEYNEQQPVSDGVFPFVVALDGRLDNRTELFSLLNISPDVGENLSDAALIIQAYACWGVDCFKYFIGEFALAIFDKQKNEVVCARDPIGERTLFYAVYEDRFVIASEPWAVVSAFNSPVILNEIAVANFFSFTASGDTFFKGVYELSPGYAMTINQGGHHTHQYWKLECSTAYRNLTFKQAAEKFRLLLDESVRCRMRSITPVGVMMSGGLDSTSIASIAALWRGSGDLKTYSFVFDELDESDERKYINAVVDRLGIRATQIPCDDVWPLCDWPESWVPNPNQPEISLYRLLHERIYDSVRQDGLRVLLTGSAGDLLYSSSEEWLADLIDDGRIKEILDELKYYIRSRGIIKFLKSNSLWRVIQRWHGRLPLVKRKNSQISKAWLTEFSVSLLQGRGAENELEPHDLIDLRLSNGYASEIFDHRLKNLDLRHPFRDRRLIEFVVSLPSYHFYSLGFTKAILRQAMADILPDEIRFMRGKIHLGPLFSFGMILEKEKLKGFLQKNNDFWTKFVKSSYITECLNLEQPGWGIDGLMPWLVGAFVDWVKVMKIDVARGE